MARSTSRVDPWPIVFIAACGVLMVLAGDGDAPRERRGGAARGTPVDLGLVRYPDRTTRPDRVEEAFVVSHDWHDAARVDRYRVTYAHGAEAVKELRDHHAELARRFALSRMGNEQFRWLPPERCRGREWTCIYSAVMGRSASHLAPLEDRFAARAASSGFSMPSAAAWLLDFVQEIPYRIPQDQAFGVLPPGLVVSQDWGDCDSKSLLLMHLLDRIGIDSVLLVSDAHRHALVGVHVPAPGEAFRHRGRRYAFAETTALHAPLGWRHPKLETPDDWRVVAVDRARSGP